MFIRVCPLADLPPGAILRVETDPPLALFNVAGALYALHDLCTHADAPLSDGDIIEEEDAVECLLHMAKFSLKDGRVLGGPACVPVRTFPIEVRGDEVFVQMDIKEAGDG